jgi:hypothetical protein
MRIAVENLVARGRLPDSRGASESEVDSWGTLVDAISMPISDDEAKVLVGLLGPDDYFGLAFSLRRLIETAPGWPIWDVLEGTSPWIDDLRQRAINSGFVPPGR